MSRRRPYIGHLIQCQAAAGFLLGEFAVFGSVRCEQDGEYAVAARLCKGYARLNSDRAAKLGAPITIQVVKFFRLYKFRLNGVQISTKINLVLSRTGG